MLLTPLTRLSSKATLQLPFPAAGRAHTFDLDEDDFRGEDDDVEEEPFDALEGRGGDRPRGLQGLAEEPEDCLSKQTQSSSS